MLLSSVTQSSMRTRACVTCQRICSGVHLLLVCKSALRCHSIRLGVNEWAPKLPLKLLDEERQPNKLSEGLTPMQALMAARSECPTAAQREAFLANARKDAILGATAKSQKSVRSGVRCWMGFIGQCLLALGLRLLRSFLPLSAQTRMIRT